MSEHLDHVRSNDALRFESIQLATIVAENSDHHGHLHSTAALRLMGRSAIAAAASATGHSFVTLSTERVAFLAPVPVGHTIAFRPQIVRLDDGRLRVSIEGLARLPRAPAARCVMTGSFVLIAVDEDGRSVPLPDTRPDARVA